MDIMEHIARAEGHRYALETLIHYHLSVAGGRYKYIIFDHEERLAGLSLLLAKQIDGIFHVKWGIPCKETDTSGRSAVDIAPIAFKNGSYECRFVIETCRDSEAYKDIIDKLEEYTDCKYLRVNKVGLGEIDQESSGIVVKTGKEQVWFELASNPYLFILRGESLSNNGVSAYKEYDKKSWKVVECYLWEFDRILAEIKP